MTSRGAMHLVPDSPDDSESRLAILEHEIAGLREALRTRAVIEQAKGMLMLRYGIPAEAAFRLLVRWSSHRNVKVRAVATALVRLCISDLDVTDRDLGPEVLLDAALARSAGTGSTSVRRGT